MKSIRIISSVKHVEEFDQNITLFRIQEILSEHRAALIMRILSDLPTYLSFKFYTKVDKEHQEVLKDKLFELANAKINIDRYAEIVQEIKNNDTYKVPSLPFFAEIDGVLDSHLNPSQLQLIS